MLKSGFSRNFLQSYYNEKYFTKTPIISLKWVAAIAQ